MPLLRPDYRFHRALSVTAEFLCALGIQGLVLDIDNTLAPYEEPLPSEELMGWFASLAAAGIRTAFVSNNDAARVDLFNRELQCPAYPKAKKPFPGRVRRAMEAMGTAKENTLLMGDQIFTDVLAARMAGIRAVLVPPIRDKRDIFTKCKRLLERPILRHMPFSDEESEKPMEK